MIYFWSSPEPGTSSTTRAGTRTGTSGFQRRECWSTPKITSNTKRFKSCKSTLMILSNTKRLRRLFSGRIYQHVLFVQDLCRAHEAKEASRKRREHVFVVPQVQTPSPGTDRWCFAKFSLFALCRPQAPSPRRGGERADWSRKSGRARATNSFFRMENRFSRKVEHVMTVSLRWTWRHLMSLWRQRSSTKQR